MLAYWFYRSKAMVKSRSQADGLIYLQASKLNPPMRISGYLHRDASTYVQYVEGPIASLRDLRRRVQADGRHYDIKTLLWGLTPQRRFSTWDMAFTNEEIASFARFQQSRCLSTSLAEASAMEVLAFMEATAERSSSNAAEQNIAACGSH